MSTRSPGRESARLLAAAISAIVLVGSTEAYAAAPTASGDAYDFAIDIKVAGIDVLTLSPADQVQFSNLATAYVDSKQTASFDSGGGLGVLARLQTGSLDVETQWVPGTTFFAVGSLAVANNVNLNAVDVLDTNLLSLQSTQIASESIITGSCPVPMMRPQSAGVHLVDDYVFVNGFDPQNLQGGSSARLPGLDITVIGTNLGSLLSNPPANTGVTLPVVGTLVLNEQTVSGDGISGLTIKANGLHLTLNVAGGAISGDIIISHTEAAIACN